MFLNQPVQNHYFNLQAVMERIGEESDSKGAFKHLFARPVVEGIDLSQAEKLDWMSELPGEGIPFPALPKENQLQIGLILKQAFARIKEFAEANRGKSGKDGQYSEFLGQIAVPSDLKCVYVFGNCPVITTWGFTPEGSRDPTTSIFVGWDNLSASLPRIPDGVSPKTSPKESGKSKAAAPPEKKGWGRLIAALSLLLISLLLLLLLWRGCREPSIPPTLPVGPVSSVASSPASLSVAIFPASVTAGIDPGSKGNISFTLVWTHAGSTRPGGPDVDLQVYDPKGGLLSSSNIGYKLGPTPEGGRIDQDDRGGWGEIPSPGGGPERAFWPDGNAPLGTYTFGVCYFKGDGEADYTLRVYDRERLVLEKAGRLSRAYEGILQEVGQVVLGGGTVSNFPKQTGSPSTSSTSSVTNSATILTTNSATNNTTNSATYSATNSAANSTTNSATDSSSSSTGSGNSAAIGGEVSNHSSSYQSSSTWQTGVPGGTTTYVSSQPNVWVVNTPPANQTFSHVSSTTVVDRDGIRYQRLASDVYENDLQTAATSSGSTTSNSTASGPAVASATASTAENIKHFTLIMDSEGSFLDQALESDPPHPATTWDLLDPQGQTFVSDKAFFKDTQEKFRTSGAKSVLRLIGPPKDKPYEVKVACTSPSGTKAFVFSVTTQKGN